MKKTIFVFGGIAGAITIAILTLTISISEPGSSHFANSEWLGFLIMIAALSLIFFGVKSYRDNELAGLSVFGMRPK
jgi:Kef-type K+ transport system membrane component KefB